MYVINKKIYQKKEIHAHFCPVTIAHMCEKELHS